MKNDFYFKDGKVHIILRNKRGETAETVVNFEDFEIIKNLPIRWNMQKNKDSKNVYVSSGVNGEIIFLHRLILNPPKNKVVDHINHNTLDNTKENLRAVSHAENMQNRNGAHKNSKSGVRGVYWDKAVNKWMAQYRLNGKPKNLGRYNTIEEAKNVVEKERLLHMVFAN